MPRTAGRPSPDDSFPSGDSREHRPQTTHITCSPNRGIRRSGTPAVADGAARDRRARVLDTPIGTFGAPPSDGPRSPGVACSLRSLTPDLRAPFRLPGTTERRFIHASADAASRRVGTSRNELEHGVATGLGDEVLHGRVPVDLRTHQPRRAVDRGFFVREQVGCRRPTTRLLTRPVGAISFVTTRKMLEGINERTERYATLGRITAA